MNISDPKGLIYKNNRRTTTFKPVKTYYPRVTRHVLGTILLALGGFSKIVHEKDNISVYFVYFA